MSYSYYSNKNKRNNNNGNKKSYRLNNTNSSSNNSTNNSNNSTNNSNNSINNSNNNNNNNHLINKSLKNDQKIIYNNNNIYNLYKNNSPDINCNNCNNCNKCKINNLKNQNKSVNLSSFLSPNSSSSSSSSSSLSSSSSNNNKYKFNNSYNNNNFNNNNNNNNNNYNNDNYNSYINYNNFSDENECYLNNLIIQHNILNINKYINENNNNLFYNLCNNNNNVGKKDIYSFFNNNEIPPSQSSLSSSISSSSSSPPSSPIITTTQPFLNNSNSILNSGYPFNKNLISINFDHFKISSFDNIIQDPWLPNSTKNNQLSEIIDILSKLEDLSFKRISCKGMINSYSSSYELVTLETIISTFNNLETINFYSPHIIDQLNNDYFQYIPIINLLLQLKKDSLLINNGNNKINFHNNSNSIYNLKYSPDSLIRSYQNNYNYQNSVFNNLIQNEHFHIFNNRLSKILYNQPSYQEILDFEESLYNLNFSECQLLHYLNEMLNNCYYINNDNDSIHFVKPIKFLGIFKRYSLLNSYPGKIHYITFDNPTQQPLGSSSNNNNNNNNNTINNNNNSNINISKSDSGGLSKSSSVNSIVSSGNSINNSGNSIGSSIDGNSISSGTNMGNYNNNNNNNSNNEWFRGNNNSNNEWFNGNVTNIITGNGSAVSSNNNNNINSNSNNNNSNNSNNNSNNNGGPANLSSTSPSNSEQKLNKCKFIYRSSLNPSRTLYLRCIKKVNQVELKLRLLCYGNIQSVYGDNKNIAGYLIVSYFDLRDSITAYSDLKTCEMSKYIMVNYCSTENEDQQSSSAISFLCLDEKADNFSLHLFFSQFGDVNEIGTLSSDRNFKYVDFYDFRSTLQLIKHFNDCKIKWNYLELNNNSKSNKLGGSGSSGNNSNSKADKISSTIGYEMTHYYFKTEIQSIIVSNRELSLRNEIIHQNILNQNNPNYTFINSNNISLINYSTSKNNSIHMNYFTNNTLLNNLNFLNGFFFNYYLNDNYNSASNIEKLNNIINQMYCQTNDRVNYSEFSKVLRYKSFLFNKSDKQAKSSTSESESELPSFGFNSEVFNTLFNVNDYILNFTNDSRNVEEESIDISNINFHSKDTTYMIKNIPNRLTQRKFLEIIRAEYGGEIDFLYLPIDPHSKVNYGYAFANIPNHKDAIEFFKVFHLKCWKHSWNDKICSLTLATIQGKDAQILNIFNKRREAVVFIDDEEITFNGYF